MHYFNVLGGSSHAAATGGKRSKVLYLPDIESGSGGDSGSGSGDDGSSSDGTTQAAVVRQLAQAQNVVIPGRNPSDASNHQITKKQQIPLKTSITFVKNGKIQPIAEHHKKSEIPTLPNVVSSNAATVSDADDTDDSGSGSGGESGNESGSGNEGRFRANFLLGRSI